MALTITIPGAVETTTGSTAPAVLTVGVGVPGATGPAGATGPQGPAGPTFTGGAITSPITYTVGTNTTVFENGDIYTENTASGAYGVVYINGLEASDGTHSLTMTASGITFGDASVQSTAFPGSAAFYPATGNPSGFLADAPSDGTIYGRQDGDWVAAGGGGGSYLPLAGGTMTGPIVFDGTSGQYISKGNFDTSRGGNYGISLVCAIGYEFNWQAGWLTTTEQSSVTPRPLYLDSLAGTTLRAWDSAADTGTEVGHTGINVANATPYYVNVAPDLLKVFEATNELGVSIAHDSIAIQHIDTPDRTSYFTNEYIGFEDLGGSPHSAWIEHDVITVQDDTNTTQMRSNGISLSAAGSITFGDSTVQTTAYTGGGGGGVPAVQIADSAINPNYITTAANFPALTYSTHTDILNGTYATSFTYTYDPVGNHALILSGLTSLNTANFNDNASMTSAPDFSGCTALAYANVINNASMASAPSFSGCTALYGATVTDNTSMTTAPSFSGLTSLYSANVNSNAAMTSAPSFSGCTALVTAGVGNNASMTSAPSFTGCIALAVVNVDGNASMTNAPDFTTITQSGIQIALTGCAISDCTTPLDQLDAGGGTSGYIDLSGGTNQAIDPAYVSLLSLLGKSWTVVFNSL